MEDKNGTNPETDAVFSGETPDLIVLLGPTAVGKTSLAAHLALRLDAEIISADSRQVFIGMDQGTGKDKEDYCVEGRSVASHLIDIAEVGTEYSVYNFLRDFHVAYANVRSQGKTAILCGGTGLYLEAAIKGYDLTEVPENHEFRKETEGVPAEQLAILLKERRLLHNTTDLTDRSRLIRALEIELFKEANPAVHNRPDFTGSPMFGLRFQRSVIRERITSRLASRFENGMISEVEKLIQQGVTPERLKYYGLEYKYITMFLLGEISYDKMFLLLNTAIHQFSKRQMTWFRRMEKHGIDIQWLEGENGMEYNLEAMECRIRKAKHNGS